MTLAAASSDISVINGDVVLTQASTENPFPYTDIPSAVGELSNSGSESGVAGLAPAIGSDGDPSGDGGSFCRKRKRLLLGSPSACCGTECVHLPAAMSLDLIAYHCAKLLPCCGRSFAGGIPVLCPKRLPQPHGT